MDGMNGHLPTEERMTLLEREVLFQRMELAQAKRRIAYLEALQVQDRSEFPPEWGLTSLESRVLRVLLAEDRVPGPRILDIVYAARDSEWRPDVKIVHVIIHKLRIKMRRHDVEIENRRSGADRGYYLPRASRELLRAAVVELPV
jgi:DNA-binding response OmpR family regulator